MITGADLIWGTLAVPLFVLGVIGIVIAWDWVWRERR